MNQYYTLEQEAIEFANLATELSERIENFESYLEAINIRVEVRVCVSDLSNGSIGWVRNGTWGLWLARDGKFVRKLTECSVEEKSKIACYLPALLEELMERQGNAIGGLKHSILNIKNLQIPEEED